MLILCQACFPRLHAFARGPKPCLPMVRMAGLKYRSALKPLSQNLILRRLYRRDARCRHIT